MCDGCGGYYHNNTYWSFERRFSKISQSQRSLLRRSLLEPSPCWMHLRALSHVRTYQDIMIMLNRREPTVSRWMLNWDTDAMVISDRLFG